MTTCLRGCDSPGAVHALQLVDHLLDHLETHVPELGHGSVEAERIQQLGVMLRSAGFEHAEILADKTRMSVLIEAVERVHEAVAEGVCVDVERRLNEVRNVGPE